MPLPRNKTAKELGFKVGDKFRVVKDKVYSSRGDIVTLMKYDESDFPLFRREDGGYVYGYLHDLEPLEKSLDTLQKGDWVEDRDGDVRKVLGVLDGDLVFLSSAKNHDVSTSLSFTTKELKDNSFKIHQFATSKAPRKVTMAEVNAKFGEEVEIVEDDEPTN